MGGYITGIPECGTALSVVGVRERPQLNVSQTRHHLLCNVCPFCSTGGWPGGIYSFSAWGDIKYG